MLAANLTNDDCLCLLQKLKSDDAEEILTAIDWFNNRPRSFDEMVARINEVSEKQYYDCDFREAISKLNGFERDDINRKVLSLLDSDDSTIQYWAARALHDKYYDATVPVLLKYFSSSDPSKSAHAMFELCSDTGRFNALSGETKNQILNEMQKVFLARYNKDFEKDVWGAHTTGDPLYISIYYLTESLPLDRLRELYDKLKKMSSCPLVYIRVEAAKGLVEVAKRIEFGNRQMYVEIVLILQQMFNDSDNSVRHEALWGMARAKSENALDAAIRATEDTDLAVQRDGIGVIRLYYYFTPKALRALRRIAPIWSTRQPSYLRDDVKLTKFQTFLSYLPF